MLPCSMVRCAEGEEEGGGKTALIDQRAVAAGKKHANINIHATFYIFTQPYITHSYFFQNCIF